MSWPARLAAVLALALLLAGTAWRIHTKADAAGYARAQAEAAAAALAQSEAWRRREHDSAQALLTIQQKAAHEKRNLQRRIDALADSLRERPERPAEPAAAPGPADPVACTGAQLYREDAAFLVREAGRADQLRADLAACQAAYDQAVTLTAQ